MVAILGALLRPVPNQADAFFAWYEAEHVPGRLTVPGFGDVERYRVCGVDPTGLLLYTLDDLSVLQSDTYHSIQAVTAQETAQRMGSLDRFVRVTGTVIQAHGDIETPPGVLFVVGLDVPLADQPAVDAWYAEEHDMLMEADGWRGVRLIAVEDSNTPMTRIALHHLDEVSALEAPERTAARRTPRAAEIVATEWFGRAELYVMTATTNLAVEPTT